MQIELAEKMYYSIGEVARAFDVNASLIRFWEKEFDVIQPRKNKKGNRYFSQQDIENLKLIYFLVKENGYTLEGARQALKNDKKVKEKASLVFRLEKIRTELKSISDLLED
ncbi:MAG: MerR family transcriptional regulator [Weeksellaceae bacterium]|nr:MerR family transcriptional regulator [Weeksellaceae bacterium]